MNPAFDVQQLKKDRTDQAWSSLVEGDDQHDCPTSQTCMDYCHACPA